MNAGPWPLEPVASSPNGPFWPETADRLGPWRPACTVLGWACGEQPARAPGKRMAGDQERPLGRELDDGEIAAGSSRTALDEHRLVQLARAGDNGALQALIDAHSRLVIALARRYWASGVPLADLIQEGTLGLLRAVERYDGERGLPFSAFAAQAIRHAIGQSIPGLRSLVTVPAEVLRRSQRAERAVELLTQSLRRKPTSAEVEQLLADLGDGYAPVGWWPGEPVSLDAGAWDDSQETLADALADPTTEPADQLLQALGWAPIRDAVEQLPEREREVLSLRYGLHRRQALDTHRTARRLGLTAAQVQQVEQAALHRVRQLVANTAPAPAPGWPVTEQAGTQARDDHPSELAGLGHRSSPKATGRGRLERRLQAREAGLRRSGG